MNVQTITMDPAEAKERLRAYQRVLRRSADEEYSAALAGYGALAEGTPILQYGPAIRDAPRDENGRPMLAIARADRRQVHFSWGHWSHAASFATSQLGRWDSRLCEDSHLLLDVDMGERNERKTPNGWGASIGGYALVPMVPPEAVEAAGGRTKLRQHLILWEVEQWADRRIQAVPDRDPYLLRPIHGDLCAVVAEWDLTDLERAVMAGRAGNASH